MSPAKKNPDDFTVDTSGVNALLAERFEPAGQNPNDGTTAQRHNGKTAPKAEAAPPAPPAKPSKYTLLLEADDALTLDQLALELRRLTGRRVEKSEMLRALIRIAYTHRPTADALTEALERRAS